MFSLKQEGVFVNRNVSIGTWGSVNSINLNIIRFSEVLLWRAELQLMKVIWKWRKHLGIELGKEQQTLRILSEERTEYTRSKFS